MSFTLNKFPNDPPPPYLGRGEGIFLYTENGDKYLDFTAGWTSYAVLGYSHPAVLAAMKKQMESFCHADYNIWRNHTIDELAELVLSRAPKGLDRVYFSGNSGSEAMEAAMKLSYQCHYDAGNRDKTWFISRDQSFHGATLHGISVSELPILEFYEQILPAQRTRIPQHHSLYFKRDDESEEEYAARSAKQLEDKILELGPEKVCAFIGETMLGSLVGDVPPAPSYWRRVKEVCERYDVHLILDEVYCGLGRSGRVFCCDWDDVRPDFVCVGKNFGAGYAPLSAVITNQQVEEIIGRGQGRIQHGHTHQGHSLGAAAALAVQKVVQTDEMLGHILQTGQYMRDTLGDELSSHPFFRDIRGRGFLFSFEYDCHRKPKFSLTLQNRMKEEHGILINAKWHRTSFTPPYIVDSEQVDLVLDRYIDVFRSTAQSWAEEEEKN